MPNSSALASLPEPELIGLVRRELAQIFGISAQPTQIHVLHWLPANPQPPVGHLALITAVEKSLAAQLPRLYLTGAGLRGQAIPDCIRQSRSLANQQNAGSAKVLAICSLRDSSLC